MIRLLSLETATDRGSFCLWSGSAAGVVTEQRPVTCPPGQTHAETLLPLLRQTLDEMGWVLADLDAVIFDAGPGMFTGLRVSAALAQGLAVGIDRPVISVSSLEALAQSAFIRTHANRVLTLLDARMNQIYAAAWQRQVSGKWEPLLAPCLVNSDALDALPLPDSVCFDAVAGTALDAYPDALAWCTDRGYPDSGARYPDAVSVAMIGAQRLSRGEILDPADAIPVYIRDRVALTTAERAAGISL